MASDTVTYRLALETRGFEAGAKKATSSFEKLNTSTGTATKSTKSFGRATAQTSQQLATLAAASGMPSGPLRALAASSQLAELGLTGAGKSMVGFNAATVGGVAAAGAMGYAVGTLIRQIPGVAGAVDKWTASLWRLFTAQEELDRQKLGSMSQADFQATIAAKHAEARLKQVAGLTAAQAKDLLLGKERLTIEQQILAGFAKQEKAAKEWAAVQEQAVKQVMDAWKQWQTLLREIEADFRAMLGSGPMAVFGTGKLPGEGSRSGQDNVLPPGVTRGQMDAALGRQAQLDAGDSLGARNKATWGSATEAGISFSAMLGDVAHAFQVLGVGSDSILGQFVGSLSVVGAGLDSIIKGQKAGGLGGALSMATGVLGIAAAGFSIVKGIFGGGPSKEELDAEREARLKKMEDDRRRIQDAAKAMRSGSIDALGTTAPEFFMARQVLTAEDARHQGILFSAAWGQVVKERGIVAASDAFKDAFAKMKADIEKAGIDAPAWMEAIGGLMGLGQNEGFRAAAGNAQNAAGFLGALGGSGGLGPAEFSAFEQEARAQFAAAEKAATEAGLDTAEATKAGFSATSPLLKALLDESVVSGQTLSEDIQKMIDAANIVPSIENQKLHELKQIRAAVQRLAGIEDEGGDGDNTGKGPHGGDNAGNPFDFDGPFKGMARGGRIEPGDRGPGPDGGHPVYVHPGETVVPDKNAADFARGVLGGSGTSVNVQNQIVVDTIGLGRNNREAFLSEVDDRVGRSFEPGSPNYRRFVKAVKLHVGRG